MRIEDAEIPIYFHGDDFEYMEEYLRDTLGIEASEEMTMKLTEAIDEIKIVYRYKNGEFVGEYKID